MRCSIAIEKTSMEISSGNHLWDEDLFYNKCCYNSDTLQCLFMLSNDQVTINLELLKAAMILWHFRSSYFVRSINYFSDKLPGGHHPLEDICTMNVDGTTQIKVTTLNCGGIVDHICGEWNMPGVGRSSFLVVSIRFVFTWWYAIGTVTPAGVLLMGVNAIKCQWWLWRSSWSWPH